MPSLRPVARQDPVSLSAGVPGFARHWWEEEPPVPGVTTAADVPGDPARRGRSYTPGYRGVATATLRATPRPPGPRLPPAQPYVAAYRGS